MLSDEYKKALLKSVGVDPHLSYDDKEYLMEKFKSDRDFTNGLIGGAVGFAISKFLKLSTTSQVLLSIAGFGIGKYLLDDARKHDKMMEYDDKTRTYKLNV
jgi:hypothetical protein